MQVSKEGVIRQDGFNPEAGKTGKAHIEGDTLRIERDGLSEDLADIYPIMTNPDSTPEAKNEYFAANDEEKLRRFSVEAP